MPVNTPQVDLIAHQTGAVLDAPDDNSALQLAHALSGVNDALKPALQGYAQDMQVKIGAQAHADALANSGAAFADAVRSGQIQPTQNPWYIQAYEKNAAAVRGLSDVTQLVSDSQSFASRTDPVAFQQEFQTKLGAIAKNYTGLDQSEGFNSVAQPLAQQAIQQNVQYNVARIRQEHEQDISTLNTTAILSAKAANGGNPSPDQVYAAMEPQHQQWLSTGGTEQEWNNVAVNSVVGAAFNSGDSSLLGVLNDDRHGQGALSHIAGPDGKPVAETLSSASYWIDRESNMAGSSALRSIETAANLEGQKAANLVADHFGYDFLQGKVAKSDILGFLQQQGVSPKGADVAIGILSKSASENQALGRALMGANPDVLALYNKANREGYSDDLAGQVADKVRTGQLDLTEGEQIISSATSRTNHLDSEQRADARSARSDARAAASDQRRLTLDQAKALKDHRTQRLGVISTALSSVGIKTLADPKQRTALLAQLQDVEGGYLASHAGDTLGASQAVDAAANKYLNSVIARHNRMQSPATAPGGNPRR